MRIFLPLLLGLSLIIAGCNVCNPYERIMNAPLKNKMPPVVDQRIEEVLQEFEAEVVKNQPAIEAALQSGITDDVLKAAETALGAPIHPEIAELYRWHDGLAGRANLFPGYNFYSLEDAIQLNKELNEAYKNNGMQLLMAHEAAWLALFPDPAGDGYYYDYNKDYASGGVFFNFRETGYYIYFPSIKNLLMALTECYRQGAYQGTETRDFNLEQKIMLRYGQEYIQ